MTASEEKTLQAICGLFRKMEHLYDASGFHSFDLDELARLISTLKESKDPVLLKLSQYHSHLHAEMNLQLLTSLMVPFERYLGKNLTDSDFIVIDHDHPDRKRAQVIPLVFILDNLRSAFNVGSIFRTADCVGISEIALCGYTSNPENEKVVKTTMGTHDVVPWKSFRNTTQALKEYKAKGYTLVAVETAALAKSCYQDFSSTPTAFIFGNERFGLGPEVLSACDEIRNIPIDGVKNSLNVGVCAAVISFEWKRQWSLK